MKLREAKRLVKRWAFTTNEITDRPICHVTMEMQYGDFPVRATGTAICQPEDDWNEAAGIGRARQKAIAQLVQQVMALDGYEQKLAAVTLTRLKEVTAHTPFNEATHSEPTVKADKTGSGVPSENGGTLRMTTRPAQSEAVTNYNETRTDLFFPKAVAP